MILAVEPVVSDESLEMASVAIGGEPDVVRREYANGFVAKVTEDLEIDGAGLDKLWDAGVPCARKVC